MLDFSKGLITALVFMIVLRIAVEALFAAGNM